MATTVARVEQCFATRYLLFKRVTVYCCCHQHHYHKKLQNHNKKQNTNDDDNNNNNNNNNLGIIYDCKQYKINP